MVFFKPNLGKFWSALDWKMLKYFMAIWNILLRFWNFYGHWVIFCSFGTFFWFLVSCAKENLATLATIKIFDRGTRIHDP
jgi:hypothetical protein